MGCLLLFKLCSLYYCRDFWILCEDVKGKKEADLPKDASAHHRGARDVPARSGFSRKARFGLSSGCRVSERVAGRDVLRSASIDKWRYVSEHLM